MKLRFVIGFAAGYVLGAKSGRERYEQARGAVRELADSDLAQRLRAELVSRSSRRGDMGAGHTSGAATGVVSPPVIVGPGPTAAGSRADADVVVPDAETAAPEAMPAKRLDPPDRP